MIDNKLREKVINGLECCMNDGCECYEPSNGKCPYYKDDASASASACTDDLLYDIYALLKSQEPVEPTIGGYADGPCKNWWYQCGSCKEALCYHDKYCSACGRAVKWE